MGRKRKCELPFCKGKVEGSKNKRRCDNDKDIHLHRVISKSVRRIMRYIESHAEFTAADVNREVFKSRLDKNEKGSMYRLFQAMVREGYILVLAKSSGLKVYIYSGAKKSIADAVESNAQNAAAAAAAAVAAEQPTSLVPPAVEPPLMPVADVPKPAASAPKPAASAPKTAAAPKPEQKPVKAKEIIKTSPKPKESKPKELKLKEPKLKELKLKESKPAAPVVQARQSPEALLIGILRDFVYQQHGQWNHDAWTWLVNRPDVARFGMHENDIGRLLEEEKAKYWLQRNS